MPNVNRDRTEAAQIAAMEAYASCVRQVVFWDRRGEPELVGSCVLMRIGERHFALTAAHVTDTLVERGHIMLGGTQSLVELAPKAYGTEIPAGGTRDDDRIDLSFVELTDEQATDLGECLWLSPTDIEVEKIPPGAEQPYLAIGYPWRKARLVRAEGRLGTVPNGFADMLAGEKLYAATGYDPEKHVLVNFHRKRVVSKAGRGVPMVKPHGMSGGGLWRFDSLVTGLPRQSDRLAGILTTWHGGMHKVMVATRAHVALILICQVHPELLPAVFQD